MVNKKLSDVDLRSIKYECNNYRNVEYVDDLRYIKIEKIQCGEKIRVSSDSSEYDGIGSQMNIIKYDDKDEYVLNIIKLGYLKKVVVTKELNEDLYTDVMRTVEHLKEIKNKHRKG